MRNSSVLGGFLALFAGLAQAQSVPGFATPAGYPAPGASAVASGDFNGDGKADVVTANGIAGGNHGVSILLSNGDGTFQPALNFVTGTDPSAVAVGDFNGDGKLDVAAINPAGHTVSILLGNGDGTLQTATLIGLAGMPVSITAADFNADGKRDLVIPVLTAGTLFTGTFIDTVLMSNGDGTFAQTSFPGLVGLVVADFNGDSRPDLALYGAATAGAKIKFGNGDGTFTDSALPFSPTFPIAVSLAVAGDFNRDGLMDIYFESTGYFLPAGRSNSGPYVYATSTIALGHGDGTFTAGAATSEYFTGGENLVVGDFNRDGRLDLATVYPGPAGRRAAVIPPNTLNVRYGLADGTFAPTVKFPAGPSTAVFTGTPLATGDFDGNGSLDVVWATGAGITAIRNVAGNPPLISKVSLSSAFAVGGLTPVTGTVTIGDPAPAGGAAIALSASDPAVSFPGGGTVTIPAGAISAVFTVATAQVPANRLVTVAGLWNGVPASTTFTLVAPVAVSTLTFAPPTIIGLFRGTQSPNWNGVNLTVALTSTAPDAGAALNLTSSNPALVTVPATLTIPGGANNVFVQANVLGNVPADTPVTISAAYQGVAQTGVLTVLTATDTITLTKAEYVVKTGQWKIEATDSDPAAGSALVFGGNGTLIGSLAGTLGAFKGQGTFSGPFTSVILQTFKGGFTTGAVAQK